MASVVQICNKALDKLGATPIVSLEDGTKNANLCLRAWEQVRDETLRDHPWNFAVKRVVLAADTSTPAWGFEYRFPLPADFLRLLEVRDLSTNQYQVENGAILANDGALYVRYIYRVTDPNLYDPLFADLVATRLAAELCEAVTQSNTKVQLLWQAYDDALIRAKRVDAQENPPSQYEEDSWVTVRF